MRGCYNMKNVKLNKENSYLLLIFGSQEIPDMGRSELRGLDFESARVMNATMDGGKTIKQYAPQEYRVCAEDMPQSYFKEFPPMWIRVPFKYRPVGRGKNEVAIKLGSIDELLKVEELKLPIDVVPDIGKPIK